MSDSDDENNATQNETKNPNISASTSKTVRIPEFWDKTPAVWFLQVENLFRLNGVKNDEKKYQHVLAALPQTVVMTVLDVIKDEKNGYAQLKTALIERNSLSEEQRLNTLLSESNAVMGDRRPSDFFRHLESLADSGTGVNKQLLLKLWMRRLPSTLNVSLVSSCQTDPTILISMADKIWDTLHKDSIDAVQRKSICVQPPMSQITSTDSTTALCAGLNEMCQQLQTLRKEINEIKQRQSFESRPRRRSFSRSQSFDRSKSRGQRKVFENCWYHYKFGSNARKCNPPCNFNKNAGATREFSKNS